MRLRAFTMLEVVLVIIILGLLLAFMYPDLTADRRQRALVESADRLRSLILMAHARAMQDGLRYRIMFPGTPDPNDPQREDTIDVPFETLQPIVERQVAPLDNPEIYGGFDVDWTDQAIMEEGTRCVAVLPGQPNFDINNESPIAGPGISRDKAVFVPLTLFPDGTTEWVTFVLTDLPFDIELEEYHISHIVNLIVDGRTGQIWMQRAMLNDEVELMAEHGASPILHVDFTSADRITEQNILEVHMSAGGVAAGRRSPTGGQSSGR